MRTRCFPPHRRPCPAASATGCPGAGPAPPRPAAPLGSASRLCVGDATRSNGDLGRVSVRVRVSRKTIIITMTLLSLARSSGDRGGGSGGSGGGGGRCRSAAAGPPRGEARRPAGGVNVYTLGGGGNAGSSPSVGASAAAASSSLAAASAASKSLSSLRSAASSGSPCPSHDEPSSSASDTRARPLPRSARPNALTRCARASISAVRPLGLSGRSCKASCARGLRSQSVGGWMGPLRDGRCHEATKASINAFMARGPRQKSREKEASGQPWALKVPTRSQ